MTPSKRRVSLASLASTEAAVDEHAVDAPAAPQEYAETARTADSAPVPPREGATPAGSTAPQAEPASRSNGGSHAGSGRPTGRRKPPAQPAPAPGASARELPGVDDLDADWAGFIRKESRLPADDYDALTQLSRRLERGRARSPELRRITDNTLIRVAVRFLIEHAEELEGNKGYEILESLRRAARD